MRAKILISLSWAFSSLLFAAESRWLPKPGLTWQEQFSGEPLDQSFNVDVYAVDGEFTDASVIAQLHARGRKVICYIDGGTWETYRADKDKFPASILGKTVVNWPDERWLDIRRLDILRPIMAARIEQVRRKGCDAFYHDWAHGYVEDTGFPLSYQDQIKYNMMFVEEARARNLTIGLINDVDQIQDLVSHYDFALNESCMDYDECHKMAPFIAAGKPVLAIQYSGDPAVLCPKYKALSFDVIFKHVALDAHRVACPL